MRSGRNGCEKRFNSAASHHFVMMTYFNFPHRYWEIHPDTQAGDALKEEINRESNM